MNKAEHIKIEKVFNGYIVTTGSNSSKSVAYTRDEVFKMIAESLKNIIPDEATISKTIDLTIMLEK